MLKRSDLWSLEDYAEMRSAFRRDVMAHKANRQVLLGDHVLLAFEDRVTVKYQIQEMLRIEKVFEAAAIQEELDAYNPLIPDGDNWKCSMLIQYQDKSERKRRLAELVGIEHRAWVKTGGAEKRYPVADEDLERSTADKTSAVHFLRYQLTAPMIAAAKQGKSILFGIDHPAYFCEGVEVAKATRLSLVEDLR